MAGLSGMKEICDYIKRSEATVLKLIREYDLPAVKIEGSWESDKGKVDEWRQRMIDGRSTINGDRILLPRKRKRKRKKV